MSGFSINMNTTHVLSFPGAWPLRALRTLVTAIGLAAICLILDFVTGPLIDLSAGFIIPVVIAAWFRRPYYACALAILQPLTRLVALDIWHDGLDVTSSAINAVIRVIVLVALAYVVGKVGQAIKVARRVKSHRGVPTVCGLCAKIQDDQGDWQPMAVYCSKHPEALHRHSLCPDCLTRDYGNHCRHD